jgi:hypothetical protein
MHRTPDTFPTFLNDVGASVLEFVAETNRERVRYRHNGYGFSLPVLAPTGTNDAFNFLVEKHYGASDHIVFIDQGIPAVMFITWPDMFYHSSQDTPDKLDSTQFKRAAVVGTACMSILSGADDEMALKVAAESVARGAERMGQAQRKGLAYLADAGDAAALSGAYKEALNAVRHQASVEKGVIQSSSVLFANPPEAKNRLAKFDALVAQRGDSLANEVKALYELSAQRLKTTPAAPAMSELEAKAAKLFAEKIGPSGFFEGMRAQGEAMEKLSAEERASVRAALEKIPRHMSSELSLLIGQKKSALEIRNFLAGEFEPVALEEVMNYLQAREKLGMIKLVTK